jgi:hypothetical protein
MKWKDGGGTVISFSGQGITIRANWLDSKTLEIVHDEKISFSVKEKSAFYCGDEVQITYKSIKK